MIFEIVLKKIVIRAYRETEEASIYIDVKNKKVAEELAERILDQEEEDPESVVSWSNTTEDKFCTNVVHETSMVSRITKKKNESFLKEYAYTQEELEKKLD